MTQHETQRCSHSRCFCVFFWVSTPIHGCLNVEICAKLVRSPLDLMLLIQWIFRQTHPQEGLLSAFQPGIRTAKPWLLRHLTMFRHLTMSTPLQDLTYRYAAQHWFFWVLYTERPPLDHFLGRFCYSAWHGVQWFFSAWTRYCGMIWKGRGKRRLTTPNLGLLLYQSRQLSSMIMEITIRCVFLN